MKKILFILSFVAFSFVSNAQSTTPRFGSGVGNDNTGRVLTYVYTSVTDAAGADSVTLKPNAWETVVRITLVDSLMLNSPSVTRSFAGDRMELVVSGASGKKVKFAATNFITAGTATLSTSGRSVISLIFDGAKWVESGRVTQ